MDLSPLMPAAQFQVTNKRETYLCTARALVFEGSIFAYNPAINEADWIPTRGLVHNLSWGEERSTVALANYIPCMQKEGKRIAKLRMRRVVSSPDDDMSTTSIEEEEESQFLNTPSMSPQTDTDHEADEESEGAKESKGDVSGWKSTEEGVECIDQCRYTQNWESTMEESRGSGF